MKVLVAGASGTVGLPVVRALVEGGHEVAGLVRSPAKGSVVRAAGARPVVGDVLDPDSLRTAAKGVEAVVHLAAGRDDFERTRVEGCRNLARAATEAGARRFVLGSGYWIFGNHEETITEESSINEDSAGRVNWRAERVARDAARDLEVSIARPGMVYGPGGWFASMVKRLREGAYRNIGGGANRWSPVHPADVGTAFRAILELGEPGHLYLVVDDAPVPVREFTSFVAESLGVPPPASITEAEAAEFTTPELVAAMTANQAASNAKLKGLGWRPRFPTYREGVPEVLAAMGGG